MVTKVLRITVENGDLEDLKKELKQVDTQTQKVEGSSKKADNALKKVGENGGAISTLDALTGGLATRIRDAAEASKLFGTQFKAALIATGIGALVAALGFVVVYWKEIVDYITDANESLEDQLHLAQTKVTVVEAEIALIDRQIQLSNAQNKNAQELIDKKKELLNFQLQELQLQKLILEEQYAQEAAEARRATFWESILGRGAQVTAEEMANLSEIEKQILQTELQLLNVQNLLSNGGNETSGTTSNNREKEQKVNPITGKQLDNEKEALSKQFEDIFEIRKTWQERQLEISNEFANSEIAITARREIAKREYEKMSAAERERIAEEEAKAKMMLYDATAAAFANASQLIGQETAAGKAFAVASSLISTYAAIANTLKAFSGVPIPGYAIAQSVAIGASGFAAVRNILATNVPGGYGNSGFSVPTTPPAFNVVGQSPEQQLVQVIQGLQDTPFKTYVVAGEVTSAQQLNRSKVTASSLG